MGRQVKEFYEGIKGKKIAFIGMGVTNRELITKFAKAGADVTLCDKKSFEELGEQKNEYKELGVKFELGENYLGGLQNQEIIMRSPGFEYYTKELVEAGKNGAKITSEMELFFEYCPCKIYAVTGSDGKTTTTTLIGEMLKEEGKIVHLGGNIGRALFPIVEEINAEDIAVVELSSFQLISMRQSPNVAIITNVTPNHLDHHKDMQEYIDAKRNILLSQTEKDIAILGQENDVTYSMREDIKGELYWFSRENLVKNGACLDEEGYLCLMNNSVPTRVVNKTQVKLPGLHNIENLLCTMAAVQKEVTVENMAKVAQTFAGVQHRIEPVAEKNGVHWYNDSIATSPTRTIAGLRSFNQKLILIAGGYDKDIPFEPMVEDVLKSVKLLILTGNTANKIEAAVRTSAGFSESLLQIIRVDDLPHAVKTANEMATEGDVVLFSPASASFDSYPNFEKRGEHFKQLVDQL